MVLERFLVWRYRHGLQRSHPPSWSDWYCQSTLPARESVLDAANAPRSDLWSSPVRNSFASSAAIACRHSRSARPPMGDHRREMRGERNELESYSSGEGAVGRGSNQGESFSMAAEILCFCDSVHQVDLIVKPINRFANTSQTNSRRYPLCNIFGVIWRCALDCRKS